ncbi:MAG TPA: helix-turn-helix domain-containing protein [Pseudonocardiaceae bacterium]|jgi:AcrR family transcriptional regulator
MTTQPVALPALDADPHDPAVTRILDAALELFEDVGIRKSTIEDIARRAGVDRVTVYRRVGSKNEIARAVITRDAQRLFARTAAAILDEESLEDQVVAAFTGLMRGLRDHALLNRLIRLEPDETLPKITTQATETLTLGIRWAAGVLAPPDADAEVLDDLAARIEIIARFIHSAMLTRQGMVDLDDENQLAGFARAYIVPIVTGWS